MTGIRPEVLYAALCIVQVGYVLVISFVVPAGDAAVDDTAAIGVVEGGIAHLLSVAEA